MLLAKHQNLYYNRCWKHLYRYKHQMLVCYCLTLASENFGLVRKRYRMFVWVTANNRMFCSSVSPVSCCYINNYFFNSFWQNGIFVEEFEKIVAIFYLPFILQTRWSLYTGFLIKELVEAIKCLNINNSVYFCTLVIKICKSASVESIVEELKNQHTLRIIFIRQ